MKCTVQILDKNLKYFDHREMYLNSLKHVPAILRSNFLTLNDHFLSLKNKKAISKNRCRVHYHFYAFNLSKYLIMYYKVADI